MFLRKAAQHYSTHGPLNKRNRMWRYMRRTDSNNNFTFLHYVNNILWKLIYLSATLGKIDHAYFDPLCLNPYTLLHTYQRLYIRTAIAVVGGSMDRSKSTCFTPGGTLLTHSSSFSNMFSTGMVKLKTHTEQDNFIYHTLDLKPRVHQHGCY